MPLLTHKELATLCGVSPSNITTYRTRAQVVADAEHSKDGKFMYDTAHPTNAAFIAKRKAMAVEQGGAAIKVPPSLENAPQTVVNSPYTAQKQGKTTKKVGESSPFSAPESSESDPFAGAINSVNLRNTKTKKEIERLTEQTELLRIQKSKQYGLVIPTDSALSLIIHHSESLKIAYYEATEKQIVRLKATMGLNDEQVAAYRQYCTETINHALTDAIGHTKKQLKNIIREYADKRAVGQHS